MIREFLAIVLLTVTLKVAVSEAAGQKCLQSDFRSYTHCIRKREANHWCSAEGCSTCAGNSCQKTCKGFTCGACPSGSCCNGNNCNACYNTICCSTASCNYCISACRHACINETLCLSTCVPQCQNDTHEVFVVPSPTPAHIPGQQEVVVYVKGVPHKGRVTSGQIPAANKTAIVAVDGVDQQATILTLSPRTQSNLSQNRGGVPGLCPNNPSTGKCCDKANCNSCYQSCGPDCKTGSDCANTCSTKLREENKTIVYNNPARFNVTTMINITNVINNTNKINSPVFVNNTNLMNFTLPNLGLKRTHESIYQNYHNQLQQGCCHVVHPQQCYNSPVYPYHHCFRRTHQECSNLCTSQFVHLAPNLTPQPQSQQQCHYINSYPYVYCGQNSVQNCDSCYVCDGHYNPESCAQQSGCSDICRQTFSPPDVSSFHFQQVQPLQQIQPVQPVQPIQPLQQVQPIQQIHPVQPVQPVQPHQQDQSEGAPKIQGSFRVIHPGSPEYQQLMRLLQNQGGKFGGAPLQYG